MPTVLARVERTVTDDVILHLIRDDTVVQLSEGDEFMSVTLIVDPWKEN